MKLELVMLSILCVLSVNWYSLLGIWVDIVYLLYDLCLTYLLPFMYVYVVWFTWILVRYLAYVILWAIVSNSFLRLIGCGRYCIGTING